LSLIAETVLREKKRIEFMIDEYQQQLSELPRGTISATHAGNNTYYYLKYRENGKVVSRYLTTAEKEDLSGRIEERRHIENMLKSLKDELKFANKALGVNQ